MRIGLPAFFAILIGLPAQTGAQAASENIGWVRYRGYSIDVRSLAGNANRDAVLASVKGQLTLADTVRIPSAKLAFLRAVPIEILAASEGRPRYADSVVQLPAQIYDTERPILLHELMHAYHHRRLRDGFGNATILSMFEQARTSGKFPANSYMLSSVPEYFAMMSSVYLHGSAARDPFARDSIRLKQPDMYAWLEREFGPRLRRAP
jgi:hypothetical protein